MNEKQNDFHRQFAENLVEDFTQVGLLENNDPVKIQVLNAIRYLRYKLERISSHPITDFLPFKSKPNEADPESLWVLINGVYLYESPTFIGLIHKVITEWKQNKHYAGI